MRRINRHILDICAGRRRRYLFRIKETDCCNKLTVILGTRDLSSANAGWRVKLNESYLALLSVSFTSSTLRLPHTSLPTDTQKFLRLFFLAKISKYFPLGTSSSTSS